MGVEVPDNREFFGDILKELIQLAYTAGSKVIDTIIQKRDRYDPATLIGSGKLKQVKEIVEKEKPDLVIFLNDLKPGQERNLRKILKDVKVIDRQALILDIFSQRARTREGKMQVEMAMLTYLLPRLAGLGPILSRLGGGIGTRGPGETMLETDRRHVRRRIQTLSKELEKLRSHRELLRESRYNRGFLTAALVGYTNSGKSTILNQLTHQSVIVEDKLFATLDPTVGKVYLGEGIEILLVDTVGFIRHLPHQLAAAFRATLEEAQEADIIIQVLDISQFRWEEHKEVTEQVLEELACDNKPTITLLNKKDLISEGQLLNIQNRIPEGIPISATKGEGFDEVKKALIRTCERFFPDFLKRYRKNYGEKRVKKYSTDRESPEYA